LESEDCAAGNVDALDVGARVGRDEKEAGVFDGVVEDGGVDGGEPLEEVGLGGLGAEGEPDPEAFGTGAGEEGAAGEALGVEVVAEVEVADVADVLDVVEGDGLDAAFEIKEIEDTGRGLGADESGERKIAREGGAYEASDDDFLPGGGHG